VTKKSTVLCAAIISSLILGNVYGKVTAQDSIATPPLGLEKQEVLPTSLMDEESYEKLKGLASKNHATNEIIVSNIKAREVVQNLEIIIGKTDKANQELWIFLISDERKIFPLGMIKSRPNKEYSMLTHGLASLKGQAFLVSTLVSDLRLAVALPDKTSITPLYFSSEDDTVAGTTEESSTMLINEVKFYENEKELKTLQTAALEVYKGQEASALKIRMTGKVFRSELKNLQVTTISLPTLEQENHGPPDDTGSFEIEISLTDLSWNEHGQIIVMAHEEPINLLESTSTPSTHQIISFHVKSKNELPTHWGVFLESNKSYITFAWVMLLLLSVILVWKTYRSQSWWGKLISLGVVLIELAVGALFIGSNTVNQWFEKGLLDVPGEEKIILQNNPTEKKLPSMTRLDENLELSPGLSTSWSNISPHIWEFVLRKNISSEFIILELQKKIQTGSTDRQYLSSLKNIISVNPNKLQIITQFPDPLLPHKLSKVYFEKRVDEKSSTELFIPLEEYSNSSRFEKNPNYFNLPFLKSTAKYQTVIKAENQESIKDLVVQQRVDIIDEPETKLWPTILQNGYHIVPKINTESLVIMTDRTSYYLKDPEIIRALQLVLKSQRILQTSYFQYGQLASQFVPPGVVGYDPNIKTFEAGDPALLLRSIKERLGIEQIVLTFQYPKQERTVARVVQQELERVGIKIIPTEIENQEYEKALLQRTTDLTLIPLDFDIGDVGPFLDALIDSKSPFNKTYRNDQVDDLVYASRTELNRVKRLQYLQEIMTIIVHEDPAGIPLLFKRSFRAEKIVSEPSWWERLLQQKILGWK